MFILLKLTNKRCDHHFSQSNTSINMQSRITCRLPLIWPGLGRATTQTHTQSNQSTTLGLMPALFPDLQLLHPVGWLFYNCSKNCTLGWPCELGLFSHGPVATSRGMVILQLYKNLPQKIYFQEKIKRKNKK